MYVDKMHTEAINAADKSMLPQTVYRCGNQFNHSNALWFRDQMRAPEFAAIKPVVTWLPAGFFD